MKLYNLLTIIVAAQNDQLDKDQRAAAIEHWDANGNCKAKDEGYNKNKCGNEDGNGDGWCCHGDEPNSCPPHMVESLKKNFEYKHAIRKNKPQEWWCVEPRPKVSSKQKAQIEKCLKSYDPNSYTTGHGKIGFFHRLLSKIVMERIDRPHYQCNTTKKLRQNFVDYLKLRKNCAKDLSDHKKKEKSKAAKQAQKEKNKVAKKERNDAKKAKNDAKKEKKEEKAAEEAAKDRRRRDEDEEEEDETEEDLFFDEGDENVVDKDAENELDALIESLMKLEDSDEMTIEDLQEFYDNDCIGDNIDADTCAEIAKILAGGSDTRSEEQKASMEVLIKTSKSRRGIVSWSKTFIPNDLAHCRKKRNKLNTKTRTVVGRMVEMRKKYNTNPDKLAAKRRHKKNKIASRSLRTQVAADRDNEKKAKSAAAKERKEQKSEDVAERLASKAEREEKLKAREEKQAAKAAAAETEEDSAEEQAEE